MARRGCPTRHAKAGAPPKATMGSAVAGRCIGSQLRNCEQHRAVTTARHLAALQQPFLPGACSPLGAGQADGSRLSASGATRQSGAQPPSRPVAAAACPPLYRAVDAASNPDRSSPPHCPLYPGRPRLRPRGSIPVPRRQGGVQRWRGSHEWRGAGVERRGGSCFPRGLHHPRPGL